MGSSPSTDTEMNYIKHIDKIIVKTFFLYFIAILGITVFISLLSIFYDYMCIIINKNLSIRFYLKIIFNFSLATSPLSCSIATMISSVMTLARLSNSLEICAMKSLGIGFGQILQPLLKSMIIIGFFVSLCSHYLAPKSLKNTFNILNNLQEINPSVMLTPGVFNHDLPGVSIFVKEKTSDQQLQDIIIYHHSDRRDNNFGGETLLTANNASLNVIEDGLKLNINLKKGTDYIHNRQTNDVTKINFDRQNILIGMGNMNTNDRSMLQLCSTQEILQLIRQQKDNINNEAKQIVNFLEQKYPNTFMNTQNKTQLKRQMMNDIINNKITTNLQQYATAIKKEHYNKLNSIRSSMHKIKFYKNIILRRIVELLVCVLFLILGTAIGILLKRGSFIIHLIMAFFFISFYYVMTIIGENIIFTSYNTEQIGILLGIISLTPFILFFYYHASHDSQILNEGIGRLQNKLLVLMKNIFTSIKKSFQEVLKKRKH